MSEEEKEKSTDLGKPRYRNLINLIKKITQGLRQLSLFQEDNKLFEQFIFFSDLEEILEKSGKDDLSILGANYNHVFVSLQKANELIEKLLASKGDKEHYEEQEAEILVLLKNSKKDLQQLFVMTPLPFPPDLSKSTEFGLHAIRFYPHEKKEFENLIEYAKGLISKVEGKSETIDSQINNQIAGFDNLKRDLTEDCNNQIKLIKESYEKEFKEKKQLIEKLVEDSEFLAHFISGRALSGFFGDRAKAEKTSAESWTKATWVFAALALITLIITFIFQLIYNINEKEINYSFLTTKILFIASLGFVAKWTSKRANKHLIEESKYHRLAINTHTIDNFIAKLKPELQDEIIKIVALKMFTEYEGNETVTEFETLSIGDAIKPFLPK